MVAGGAEHRKYVGGHADRVVVHLVIDQHIPGDVDIGMVNEVDAQSRNGFGQRHVLQVAGGHGFSVRGGIYDGGVVSWLPVGRVGHGDSAGLDGHGYSK